MQTLKKISFVLFLFSVLFTACRKDDAIVEIPEDVITSEDIWAEGLTFDMQEGFSPSQLVVTLATAKHDNSFDLLVDWTIVDKKISIDATGELENNWFTAEPKRTIDLPFTETGTYQITINTPFEETQFELVVSDIDYTLNTIKEGDVSPKTLYMKKIPHDAIWGDALIVADVGARQLVNEFIDSLQNIGAVYAPFEAGNYGNRFSIDVDAAGNTLINNSANSPFLDLEQQTNNDKLITIPFALSYTGEIASLNAISEHFGLNAMSDPVPSGEKAVILYIRGYNTKNEQFDSQP